MADQLWLMKRIREEEECLLSWSGYREVLTATIVKLSEWTRIGSGIMLFSLPGGSTLQRGKWW